ncbi:class I SAM-dependent rRNA methyltransferase [Aureitalea marina]|uniref:SAM-dependent methyltransferase n=1 Tax=Aureitalea marina TaxID=930804 RepID=A0A2S7KP81_9FLAO|nr:class I SAM-dependent rRNA methyltransferase [Aureitalea marina]PQB04388.1 SAM-dependent methyltransferase [Aureitalea marina]
MGNLSEGTPTKRLAVKLKPAAQTQLIKGHPWIFDQGIAKISEAGKAGDLCVIFDNRTNKLIGIGLFDPDSVIRIKIIHRGGPIQINPDFFQEKLLRAMAVRRPLTELDVTAYRVIFGENDGFPAIILDRYNDVLVVKIYSEIWVPYLEMLIQVLAEQLSPRAIVGRLGRKVAEGNGFNFKDGDLLYGELENPEVLFREHGVKFQANLIKGHKTGFFLDHRQNRKRVGDLSRDKRVLDVFSYAGGFSIHALHGGAAEVHSLDVSAQALQLAQDNAGLNDHKGTHFIHQGDAFQLLSDMVQKGEQFDLVVIDPPSFAGQASQVKLALKQYGRLARLGEQLTKDGGMLVLASCSSRVTAQSFFDRCEHSFREMDRKFKVLETTYHDQDHPIGFPEGAYLKCRYYRL